MLTVSRVSALPGALAANTVYLVADGAADLKIVVTGSDAAVVKSTLSKAEIQGLINTSIANDTAAIPVYAADIAARNAIIQTKNAFVLVADATGDATVASGAALYFYNHANTTYYKVSEYESMDLVIPNMGILADFSDVSGQLFYKGAAVATVHNLTASNEW